MNFYDEINGVLFQSKKFSTDFLDDIQQQEKYGDSSDLKRYIIFIKWIEILQDVYDHYFDDDLVFQTDRNLTEIQVRLLMSKLIRARGNKKYVASDWLLRTGAWDDSGRWSDNPSDVWNDF